MAANLETITAERAHEVIEMNKQGKKPLSLQEDDRQAVQPKSADLLVDTDLSRFDKAKKKHKNHHNNHNKNRNRNNHNNTPHGGEERP
jgi:hypothetical protein